MLLFIFLYHNRHSGPCFTYNIALVNQKISFVFDCDSRNLVLQIYVIIGISVVVLFKLQLYWYVLNMLLKLPCTLLSFGGLSCCSWIKFVWCSFFIIQQKFPFIRKNVFFLPVKHIYTPTLSLTRFQPSTFLFGIFLCTPVAEK